MPKKEESKLTLDIYNLKGEKVSQLTFIAPKIDMTKNLKLLAQAVRVYLANQRQGTQSSKTRGEVVGSTRKIYRQKGTGRARHGDIKAPIFVGGGIVFGPKPRDFELNLNKKMKKKAFLVSVIDKIKKNKLMVIRGLGRISAKTKEFYQIFTSLFPKDLKRGRLLLVGTGNKNVYLACRNIPFVRTTSVDRVNAYEILSHSNVLVEEEGVNKLFERLGVLLTSSAKQKGTVKKRSKKRG